MRLAVTLFVLVCTVGVSDVFAQQLSPFDKTFGTIKFLDAYFGQPDQKLEVRPGDSNVPLTVVIANVGSETITGIRGQISMPLVLSAPDGSRSALADAGNNAGVGQTFYLTFFVNVSAHAQILDYNALVSVDYSRLRESGVRNEVFEFEFNITGDTVINASARDNFITSLHENTIVIDISNTGTAPLSGVTVSMNESEQLSMPQQSMTNMENIVFSTSSWDLGNIDAGSSKPLITNAYVPGTLSDEVLRIPLLISYINAQGDIQTVTRIADFYVQGFIDTRVYNVSVILLAGTPTLVGEIINEGNENALFGFVTVIPLGVSNIVETTQFIDEIEIESPVPFSVPIKFDGMPQYGDHDIRVDVRYKDSTRQETVLSHETTVYVPEPVIEEESMDAALLFIILIPVVAFILWRRRSRRKSDMQ